MPVETCNYNFSEGVQERIGIGGDVSGGNSILVSVVNPLASTTPHAVVQPCSLSLASEWPFPAWSPVSIYLLV